MYRFLIIVAGLAVAAGCYVLIHRTRLGMLIRAGSTDRMMVGALGVNIARLNTLQMCIRDRAGRSARAYRFSRS